MNRSLVYFAVAVGVIGASVGGYYYWTHVAQVRVDTPVLVPGETAGSNSATGASPDHGSFDKRFKPSMPAPDGGKGS